MINILARYSKKLNDVASFIPLDGTTLNPDHKMVTLHFKCPSGDYGALCTLIVVSYLMFLVKTSK